MGLAGSVHNWKKKENVEEYSDYHIIQLTRGIPLRYPREIGIPLTSTYYITIPQYMSQGIPVRYPNMPRNATEKLVSPGEGEKPTCPKAYSVHSLPWGAGAEMYATY